MRRCSVRPVRSDVRILAATNRDLAVEASRGRFRQDLYYRLNVVRIALPPLRTRSGDLPLLVDHFIRKFNALQGRRINAVSDRAMASLLAYRFPGNVRELENAVEHAFVASGSTISQNRSSRPKDRPARRSATAGPRGRWSTRRPPRSARPWIGTTATAPEPRPISGCPATPFGGR